MTGPAALALDEAAQVLSAVVGKSVRHLDVLHGLLKAGLLGTGQSDWQATASIELNAYLRQGHASVTDTVERITGLPTRTLTQSWEDHTAAFRP